MNLRDLASICIQICKRETNFYLVSNRKQTSTLNEPNLKKIRINLQIIQTHFLKLKHFKHRYFL